MPKPSPPAIFLMGPTASGKTDLAMALCERLPCDLISVDSAMIYRGMDIGTAKPTAEELARAPHRLIDICDPAERYSAANFRRDALAEMAGIQAAGRIPLLVGGTMMYFKALLHGLSDLPSADDAMRQQLLREVHLHGWDALHQQLQALDPQAARLIHPNNHQRLIRALEVIRLSGQSISRLWREQGRSDTHAGSIEDYPYFTRWQADERGELPYTVVQLAIAPAERAELHARIRARFLQMMNQGFIDEVRMLRARADLTPDMPSMRCVGYRQAWAYLEGRIDRPALIDKGIAATRQLAKRQLTWLRKWPDVHWLGTESEQKVADALKIIESRTTLD